MCLFYLPDHHWSGIFHASIQGNQIARIDSPTQPRFLDTCQRRGDLFADSQAMLGAIIRGLWACAGCHPTAPLWLNAGLFGDRNVRILVVAPSQRHLWLFAIHGRISGRQRFLENRLAVVVSAKGLIDLFALDLTIATKYGLFADVQTNSFGVGVRAAADER